VLKEIDMRYIFSEFAAHKADRRYMNVATKLYAQPGIINTSFDSAYYSPTNGEKILTSSYGDDLIRVYDLKENTAVKIE
jgi:hypothetical protein